MKSSLINAQHHELTLLPGSGPDISESERSAPKKNHFADVACSAMVTRGLVHHFTPVEANDPSWAQSTVTAFKEVGARTLRGKWQFSRSVDLPAHCGLGLTLQTQEHSRSSQIVTDNDYRNAYTIAMAQQFGKKIAWTESKGIMEAGTGIGGTIPLGNIASVNFGFKPKAIFCYRTLYPHPTGVWNTIRSTVQGHSSPLPLSASAAKTMAPGSTFEISAVRQISAELGAGVSAGVGLSGAFMAGAHLGLTGAERWGTTTSIEVMAINGKNLFRITVGEITDTQESLTALFSAGLNAQVDHIIPAVGEGALKTAIEKLGGLALSSTIDAFLQLSAKGLIYHREADTNNLIFILNVDHERGSEFYQHLMGLNVEPVKQAAQCVDSGVKLMVEKGHSGEDGRSIELVVGPQQALMAQVADLIDNSVLSTPGGRSVSVKREVYRKKSGIAFFKSREISFSTMLTDRLDGSPPVPFWRLSLNESMAYSKQKYVDRFLRVFLAAKATGEQPFKLKLPDMNLMAKVFTNADDLHSVVDIFLCKKGIESINKVKKEEAVKAYLSLAYELSQERKPFLMGCPVNFPQRNEAERIVQEWRKLDAVRSFNPFVWIEKAIAKTELENSYQELTQRDLVADANIVNQSHLFGKEVERLADLTDDAQCQRFFIELGKSSGFNYEQAFLTLCQLAGAENKLIHRLAIQGAGVCLEAKDEGHITHPKEEILRLYEQGRSS